MIRRLMLMISVAGAFGCGGGPPRPPSPTPQVDTTANPSPEPAAPGAPVGPPVHSLRPRASVRLAFVGDINLGTLTLSDGIPPDEGRALLREARAELTGDLVVGNFEGVLGDSGVTRKCGGTPRRVGYQVVVDSEVTAPRRPHRRPPPPTRARGPGCYAFLTPTALASRLADAGFTHLNLANNHSNDFGPAARGATDSILSSLGMTTYGPLGRIAVDSVRHGDSVTTVGIIGFAPYGFAYDLLDIDRSAAIVDSVRPMVDLLVVTFHGGSEGASAAHTPEHAESLGVEPRGDLRRWARAVVDAGADAVVGHGPHVLRGIEFYRGKPVAYSLGNFLTFRGFNVTGALGITGVLQLEYHADGQLARARLVPMVQHARAGPRPDSTATAATLVGRLSMEDFGESAARIAEDGTVTGPELAANPQHAY